MVHFINKYIHNAHTTYIHKKVQTIILAFFMCIFLLFYTFHSFTNQKKTSIKINKKIKKKRRKTNNTIVIYFFILCTSMNTYKFYNIRQQGEWFSSWPDFDLRAFLTNVSKASVTFMLSFAEHSKKLHCNSLEYSFPSS